MGGTVFKLLFCEYILRTILFIERNRPSRCINVINVAYLLSADLKSRLLQTQILFEQ